jgi:hypothetical protein
MKTLASFILFTFLVGSVSSCASPSRIVQNQSEMEKFESVKIGDPASNVSQLWGTSTANIERFQSVQYDILQYSDENNVPVAMFALDPQSQLVAGKAWWVSSQTKESDFEYALKNKFSGISFRRFIPCETRSPQDEVLVSQEKGLFLFRRMERLMLISWADPKLTDLRIEQFYKQCPKLQTEKRQSTTPPKKQ